MTTTDARMSLDIALQTLQRHRTDQVVVSTMTVMQPWLKDAGTDRDIRCSGFMGGASTLALGVALARPDVPVWVLDGDGSLGMQLGSLLTIANAAPRKFLHVVFHNSVYDTSGGQPILAEDKVSFTGLAQAAGYTRVARFDNAEELDAAMGDLMSVDGPVLVELMTQPLGKGRDRRTPPTERPTPALALNWPVVAQSLASD